MSVRGFLIELAQKWRASTDTASLDDLAELHGGDARLSPTLAVLVDHPYGRCSRCYLSWKRVEGQMTWYGCEGMFPLCKGCWAELTPQERLPHYRVLFDRWQFDAKRNGDAFTKDWAAIEAAVLEGK